MGKKEEGTGCWYIVIRLYWLVIHKVGGREGGKEGGREGGREEGGREGRREKQEEGGHKATREVKHKDFQCGYNFREKNQNMRSPTCSEGSAEEIVFS